MIDTDKYEGHAKEGWHFDSAHVLRDGYDKEIAELVGEDWLDDKATQALIADAPLLLAEVKRLREQVECSKDEHEWELDDYLDGDPNEPVRIVETCVACGLVRERIE